MTNTLEILRQLREARQRAALAQTQRQNRLVSQSRQGLLEAQTKLTARVASKAAVAARVASSMSSGGSVLALQDAALESAGHTQRIEDSRQKVVGARTEHVRCEGHLSELQRVLRRADANQEKIRQVGERAAKTSTLRIERREEDTMDETALRRLDRLLVELDEDGAAVKSPWDTPG